MHDLARRLVAASQTASDPHIPAAVLMTEKLRIPLTRFAGADGSATLLRRALTLAIADVPSLHTVTISAGGRLEGLGQLPAGMDPGAKGGPPDAAVAITAHLLGLLVTFIGVPFTLRLVAEAWPDISMDGWHPRIEGD